MVKDVITDRRNYPDVHILDVHITLFIVRWSDATQLGETFWESGYPDIANLGWYCGYQKTKNANGKSNVLSKHRWQNLKVT